MSGICDLKSEVKPRAFGDQQGEPGVVADN
jgi:hypothetical protein